MRCPGRDVRLGHFRVRTRLSREEILKNVSEIHRRCESRPHSQVWQTWVSVNRVLCRVALSCVSLSPPNSVRMSLVRFVLLCHTPWSGLGHDFGRFGPRLVAVDPVLVCLPVRGRGCVMSVSESLSVLWGVPGFRDVGSLTVRELRVELADVPRLRAVLDGRLVDIVRRIEESTGEVGTHEGGQSETWMRGASLSPDTRSVAVQSSGILPSASASSSGLHRIAVQSSEIVSPVSPLSNALRPHRRMDRNRSLSSTMYVFVRRIGGGVLGASVRMLCLCRDLTVVETVQYPLGRVDS